MKPRNLISRISYLVSCIPRIPHLASRIVFLAILILAPLSASAHEVRPAYLELHEEKAGEFRVLWKTPMRGEMRLSLSPEFSGVTEATTPVATRERGGAAVQTWRFKTIEPLRGQSVRIAGLEGTMTDALVRMEFSDGTTWMKRLTSAEPEARIPTRPSGLSVAGEYLKLGVEHILFGIDHLLFVLALLLVVSGTRGAGYGFRDAGYEMGDSVATRTSDLASLMPLIKTITAFTLAHSITLGLATLGFVHAPPAPVEAVIALSIVFVAAEIVHTRRGREGITARAPWIVAFAFGLLHGLGFAGALSEIGLPQGQIPVALLFFNLGVEAGQLLFIAAVLALMWVARYMLNKIRDTGPGIRDVGFESRISYPGSRIPNPASRINLLTYAIGILSMFWVIQRIAVF